MQFTDPTTPSQKLQFDQFTLYPIKRQLLKNGQPVRIGSRAMDILLLLVQHPGEVLEKPRLLQNVWGPVVVEDINLRVHISALRRALGVQRSGEPYIVNVPLRGYVFMGVVEPTSAPPFEPLRAHPLPVPLTELEGREPLIDYLGRMDERARFITLVGPGGVGKTSTAIRFAERASSRQGYRTLFFDVCESAAEASIETRLRAILADDQSPLRLLMDTCEQRVESTAFAVEALLRDYPRLKVLATSREPLRAEAEHIVRLAPLSWPEQPVYSLEHAMEYSALRLFMRCAREAGGHLLWAPAQLELVRRACHALHGIPLAIEMAARQTAVMGLEALTVMLTGLAFHDLPGRRTAPRRHQTLHASWNWSLCRLTQVERQGLQELAKLNGSFSLQQAVKTLKDSSYAHCCHLLVQQMVDKSLLALEWDHDTVQYRVFNSLRALLLGSRADEAAKAAALVNGFGFSESLNTHAHIELPRLPFTATPQTESA